jgi:ABC-type Fe3+ transport system permease subunit
VPLRHTRDRLRKSKTLTAAVIIVILMYCNGLFYGCIVAKQFVIARKNYYETTVETKEAHSCSAQVRAFKSETESGEVVSLTKSVILAIDSF